MNAIFVSESFNHFLFTQLEKGTEKLIFHADVQKKYNSCLVLRD